MNNNPNNLLQYDTLDDRREIHYMLSKLSPARRIAFLRWACSIAGMHTAPLCKPMVQRKTLELAELAMHDDSADSRLALECYMDLWFLSMQYSFNLDLAVAELERWTAGKTGLVSALVSCGVCRPASVSARIAGTNRSGRPN